MAAKLITNRRTFMGGLALAGLSTPYFFTRSQAQDKKRVAVYNYDGALGKFAEENYIKPFEEKFDVRVDEDLTASYRATIIESWVNFTQEAAGTAYARTHPEQLVSEVSLWTRRVAALDSGALQLRRYYAIKMGSSKSS